MTLRLVNKDAATEKQNALDMLDEVRQRIESGETLRIGIVQVGPHKHATEFSSGLHALEDGALLVQLGLRMIGLAGDGTCNPDQ